MSYDPGHFVDREPQLEAFEARLKGIEERPVLLFCGLGGAGKSSLLTRLRSVCQDQKKVCTLVDLCHDGLSEPEEVINLLCRRIPALGRAMETGRTSLPPALPETVARGGLLSGRMGAGPSFPAEPAAGSTIDASMRDVVDSTVAIGNNIAVFNNSPIYAVPEGTLAAMRQERLSRLTRVLLEELRQLASQELLVLLFDACDEASKEARKWLWTELLDPLLESFPFPTNLVIVLAGNPECEKGIWLNRVARQRETVGVHKLGELPPEAVREYWIELRGLDESTLPESFCSRGALPHLMVLLADNEEA